MEKCGVLLVAVSFVVNLAALYFFARWSSFAYLAIAFPAKGLSALARAFLWKGWRGKFAVVCQCGAVDVYRISDKALLSASGDCDCASKLTVTQ